MTPLIKIISFMAHELEDLEVSNLQKFLNFIEREKLSDKES
jgi:hypothetical protein